MLCGSSISMMESQHGYESPLYGRRTEQILLNPLTSGGPMSFFPHLKPKDVVLTYTVLGRMPAYLLEFDYGKSLLKYFYGHKRKNVKDEG